MTSSASKILQVLLYVNYKNLYLAFVIISTDYISSKSCFRIKKKEGDEAFRSQRFAFRLQRVRHTRDTTLRCVGAYAGLLVHARSRFEAGRAYVRRVSKGDLCNALSVGIGISCGLDVSFWDVLRSRSHSARHE